MEEKDIFDLSVSKEESKFVKDSLLLESEVNERMPVAWFSYKAWKSRERLYGFEICLEDRKVPATF